MDKIALTDEKATRISTMANEGTNPDENKVPKKVSEPRSDPPPWWLFASLVFSVGLVLIIISIFTGSAAFFGVMLLLGISALCVGGLLGFLFGIPRSGTDESKKYNPNTNLEQVSDWLTKIIIGVSLAEFRTIQLAIIQMGSFVENSLGTTFPATNFISQTVAIFGGILGFLVSYLWTRLYYGPLQSIIDDGVWAKIHNEVNTIRNDLQRQTDETSKIKHLQEAIATGELASKTMSPGESPEKPGRDLRKSLAPGLGPTADREESLDPGVQEKLEKFEKLPRRWSDDPLSGIFPNAPRSQKGYRFNAEIDMNLSRALYITLEVTKENEPIDGVVMFLLHPTYKQRIEKVLPDGNSAKLQILAEGWFTAVVLLEGGKIVLSYDLREIPGVPKWFKDA